MRIKRRAPASVECLLGKKKRKQRQRAAAGKCHQLSVNGGHNFLAINIVLPLFESEGKRAGFLAVTGKPHLAGRVSNLYYQSQRIHRFRLPVHIRTVFGCFRSKQQELRPRKLLHHSRRCRAPPTCLFLRAQQTVDFLQWQRSFRTIFFHKELISAPDSAVTRRFGSDVRQYRRGVPAEALSVVLKSSGLSLNLQLQTK